MNLTDALLDPITDRMGPRITYYDDASGERVEVSTVTLANWAAKTANLLRDELGAGPASRVAVLLPPHWQTVAVLLGVWWIGAEVISVGDADIAPSVGDADIAPSVGDADIAPSVGDADITLCTRNRLDEADGTGGEAVVLSLDAFGRPASDLPVGVTDYATAVRVHGDQVFPERAPGPALAGRPAAEVLEQARRRAGELGLGPGDRVMAVDPDTDTWLAVLAAGASLVMVTNPDPAAMPRRRVTEKVTRVLV